MEITIDRSNINSFNEEKYENVLKLLLVQVNSRKLGKIGIPSNVVKLLQSQLNTCKLNGLYFGFQFYQ